ncbi:Ku70/Ku80 N-terminal alpha/beta domain-containing protein [Diaporthe helianthi]|uniref:ATP-dependent DNA helicase II subunit 2 n=1 Tax=Diaporthe helianthi TaxID=158607 RepID=A0A2P5IC34_DIAHE|nr:Ku70/Ku80 N-terminal alpha/beta domain-containing protein [Diaporthe helianthi]
MADKEAFVYIVDLGSTTSNCNNGRAESDLDFSMRYVWDKIATTAQASRKTWNVGVIGLRTDETQNDYQDGDGYNNISVLKKLGPVSLANLKELSSLIKPSSTEFGDAMSAIIVAAEMIGELTKKLKYTRRIYLITDGQGPMDEDDVEEISSRLNELQIELVVLGVDFDDPEFGFKEEDKPQIKATNEAILKSLVDNCNNGTFGTLAEAVEELSIPRVKPVRLVKCYDGPLTIGNPAQFPSATSINVERWPATKVSRPAAATTVTVKQDPYGTQSTHTLGEEMDGVEYGDPQFNSVKQHRTYRINDPGAPGGKRDVEFEELNRGWAYGNTPVYIPDADKDLTTFGAAKSFSVVGFVSTNKVEPFLTLGETSVTVARSFDEESKLALSALIHALYESEMYAVSRLVSKDGRDPVIVLMRPSIDPDFECLYDVPLPFAEDVRSYRFPPLDKVVTIHGKVLTEHSRLLPDAELNQAMSDYVDAMDISEFDQDDEGNPAEYAALEDLYSPIIHRVNQAVRARAVAPDGNIAEVPDILKKYSEPPEKLLKQAQPQIDALKEVAKLKNVPPKARGKWKRGSAKTESGRAVEPQFDIDELFRAGAEAAAKLKQGKLKIDKDNSIPMFKQLVQQLAETDNDKGIEAVTSSMGDVVKSLIQDSMGDTNYDRAIENIGELRDACIGLEVPELFNDFLRDLKSKIFSDALGKGRRYMWTKLRATSSGRLGLIAKSESEVSRITDKEKQALRKGLPDQ